MMMMMIVVVIIVTSNYYSCSCRHSSVSTRTLRATLLHLRHCWLTMVKKLSDLSLGCIQQHLSTIPQLGANLPTLYKERLIERLAYHDMLHKSYLPHISANLFCAALRHIKLYKCDQVDDHFLELLAECRCQLEVLVINGCCSVTGNLKRALVVWSIVCSSFNSFDSYSE